MQISKRILSVLLCLAMLLALCSCAISDELLSYLDDDDEASDNYRSDAVLFDDMQYARPDIKRMQELCDSIEDYAPRLLKMNTTAELVSEFNDLMHRGCGNAEGGHFLCHREVFFRSLLCCIGFENLEQQPVILAHIGIRIGSAACLMPLAQIYVSIFVHYAIAAPAFFDLSKALYFVCLHLYEE